MKSTILSCKCSHPAQDLIYGNGKRLMNPTKGRAGEKIIFRCTVCSTVKASNEA